MTYRQPKMEPVLARTDSMVMRAIAAGKNSSVRRPVIRMDEIQCLDAPESLPAGSTLTSSFGPTPRLVMRDVYGGLPNPP